MFSDLVQMMRFIIGQDFFFIAFRQDEMGKFHLECFFETKSDTGNGHDLSGETDLSECHEVLRDRGVASDGDQ